MYTKSQVAVIDKSKKLNLDQSAVLLCRDGTILNITESMRYYTIRYCYRLYIALDDNIEKAVISLVI